MKEDKKTNATEQQEDTAPEKKEEAAEEQEISELDAIKNELKEKEDKFL